MRYLKGKKHQPPSSLEVLTMMTSVVVFLLAASSSTRNYCQAFQPLSGNNNIRQTRIKDNIPLGASVGEGTQESSSSLNEGKLTILQDVVKELDARNKRLQQEFEANQRNYDRILSEKDTKLEEAEKRDKQLSDAKTLAETNLEDSQKLQKEQTLEIQTLRYDYEGLQQQLKDQENDKKELLEKISDSQRSSQALSQTVKGLTTDLKESRSLCEDQESKLRSLESDLESVVDKERSSQQQLLEGLEEQHQEDNKSLETEYETKLGKVKARLYKKEAHADDLMARLKETKSVVEQNENDLKELSKDYKNLQREKSKLKDQLLMQNEQLKQQQQSSPTDEETKEFQSTISKLERTIGDLQAQLETSRNEVIEAKASSSSNVDAQLVKELRGYIEELEEQNAATQTALAQEKDAVIDKLTTTVDTLETARDDLLVQVKDLQAESKGLRSDMATIKNESEERLEIAKAAVDAGEQKQAKLVQESKKLSKTIQFQWLLARMAILAYERLVEANDDRDNGKQ